MPDKLTASARDLHCICCDTRLYYPVQGVDLQLIAPSWLISEHHRVLGDRSDNRLQAKILLQGSGTIGCHWRWHNPDRVEAERLGYIVRRAFVHRRCDPLLLEAIPVWYNQPSLSRVGWQLLPEDGKPVPFPLEASASADAIDLAIELERERST